MPPRKRKPKPYAAFKDNIADAEALLNYAIAFENRRSRSMRRELRGHIGDALRVPQKQRDKLDCLESDDVFLVFLPGGSLNRGHFRDLRPLLRQSLVAACAALETYVADKAWNSLDRQSEPTIPHAACRKSLSPLGIGLKSSGHTRNWGGPSATSLRTTSGRRVAQPRTGSPRFYPPLASTTG